MLQLHDFLQNVPNKPNFFPIKEMLTGFAKSGDGAAFDFGDMNKLDDDVLENLMHYSHELAKHKILKLPYNPVYYSWSLADKLFAAYIIQEEHPQFDSFKAVFMMGEQKPFRYAGMGTVEIKEFGIDPPKDRFPNVPDDVVPINIKGTIAHFAKGASFANDEAQDILYQSICFYIVSLTALMESPHTKTRVTSVGAKLNLKRAKRGVPHIMPFHTVYFEVDGKEYNTDGTSRGTGAQKRMHWRRGHIRHLSGGKITHVRPCLVGALGTDAHVAKPAYSMKQRGNVA